MSNISALVEGLTNRDDKQAYDCLKQLEAESDRSSKVYAFFDNFIEMLDSDNSYIRTRAILLVAANAKWDTDNKIDEIIDKYLKFITDEKPITARQCIKALPAIAKHKPDLKNDIENALHYVNPIKYKESMRTLILKDIQKSLADIHNI